MTSSPPTSSGLSTSPLGRWGWIIVFIVTVGSFSPVLWHEFVLWDDHREIFQNPHLNPPTWDGLVRLWEAPYYRLYVPLSYSVQWLAAQAARRGDGSFAAGWFHAISLIAHGAAAVGVWGVLRKIVGPGVGTVAGALVFALHPLQVEPVNWASSFYTVFSGAMGIGALWLYLEYRDRVRRSGRGARGWAGVATLLYLLAIISKPSLVALPLIAAAIEVLIRGARVREVAPLLVAWIVLGLPASFVTVGTQAGSYHGHVPLWECPLVAADAVAWYLGKMVWPWPMGIDYGRSPEYVERAGQVWWTWIIPAGLGVGVWLMRRRASWPAGALAVFVAGVLPFLGFFPFGFQRYSTVADRYTYIALLGPAIASAELVWRWPRYAGVIVGLICVAFGVGVVVQSAHWHSTRPLMNHALDVNPTSRVAHDVLAYVATLEHRDEEALEHYSASLRAFPNDAYANYNMGNRALGRGELEEAIRYYNAALEDRPDDPDTRANLGVALAHSGRAEEAEREFRKAAELAPDSPNPWTNLGALYASQGRIEDARRAYEMALKIDPRSSLAQAGLRKLDARQ